MTLSTRLLLAASLCLTPLGWAAAQDQQQGDQRQREKQEQHPQQQQRPPQQPPNNQQHSAPQQGNTAPQGKGAGGPSGAQQFQRPPQTNAAPPNAQTFQRPPQTNATPPVPPTGATASPTPPPGQNQFRRVQGPPQGGGAAPTGSAQQQQQFQQRSVQRGAPPTGATAPQTQQQQTTISRGNFQSNTRSNPAAFAQHHGGAAPVQFSRGRFYGRDYAHFTPHDVELWSRGAWRHEFHDGRFGWWYAVDDIWYFYDQPIYPYPTFVPDVVYIPEEEYDDGPVYADAPPEGAPPQYGQPATYYYYFCPDLQTYYPYVTSCPSPWQPVPAAPQ